MSLRTPRTRQGRTQNILRELELTLQGCAPQGPQARTPQGPQGPQARQGRTPQGPQGPQGRTPQARIRRDSGFTDESEDEYPLEEPYHFPPSDDYWENLREQYSHDEEQRTENQVTKEQQNDVAKQTTKMAVSCEFNECYDNTISCNCVECRKYLRSKLTKKRNEQSTEWTKKMNYLRTAKKYEMTLYE